jgi:hypothetical protein
VKLTYEMKRCLAAMWMTARDADRPDMAFRLSGLRQCFIHRHTVEALIKRKLVVVDDTLTVNHSFSAAEEALLRMPGVRLTETGKGAGKAAYEEWREARRTPPTLPTI